MKISVLDSDSDSDSVFISIIRIYIYKNIYSIYNGWHSITYNCGHRLRYMYL